MMDSYRRRPFNPQPRPAAPPPAVTELMADHFHAKEFGVAGELSIPRPAEPGTVMFTPRFVIPEVDWQAEREEREAREREEAVRAIARIPITTEAADQLEPADAPPRPDRPAQPQRRGPRNAAA